MFAITKITIDLLTLGELHRAEKALETLNELDIDVDRYQTLHYIRLKITDKEEHEKTH